MVDIGVHHVEERCRNSAYYSVGKAYKHGCSTLFFNNIAQKRARQYIPCATFVGHFKSGNIRYLRLSHTGMLNDASFLLPLEELEAPPLALALA